MITIEQCRAARGLLGWTQQDLADASGLSKTAINNFEKEHSEIKAESLRAIQRAFESLEIEFLDNQGLRKRANHAETLYGDGAFRMLLSDILATAFNKGQPLLISNLNKRTFENLTPAALQETITALGKRGIATKIVYEQNAPTISGTKISERTLPQKYAGLMPTCFVYGRKCALQFSDHPFITIIDSEAETTRHREKFEWLWESAEHISDETAKAKNAR